MIFLIRVDVDKKKKSNLQKKKKLRNQVWGPNNIFTYK
jgi:hypothetical protein